MADSYSDRDPVEELAEEYLARLRRGENPAVTEYTLAHPEHAEAIRELFPALVKIERLRPEPDEGEDRNDLIDPDSGRRIEQLGDFRIIRNIGRGGMGAVYEAEQVTLARRVALKVLMHRATRERRTVERFRREARAAARLHHTNIVPVFEVGQDRGLVYYAMQFIEGQGLDRVIDELARLRTGEPPSGAKAGSVSSGTGARDRPKDRTSSSGERALELTGMAHSLLSGVFASGGLDGSNTDRSGGTSTDTGEIAVAPAAGGSGSAPTLSGSGVSQGSSANGHESRAEGAAGRPAAGGQAPEWAERLSAFPWPADRAPYYRSVAHIASQIAQGLAHAHARGIIHRDVKPSNLLLDSAGVVWITDFGLAKAEDDGLTQTGDIVGTVRYMAPERFRGQSDSRADLYSLGLTIYELVTFRPAFESSDRVQLMQRIQAEEPIRPRAIDLRVPFDLETIVLKAIDKDPARRYPHAEAMAEDLRRFLADEPIRARPFRTWERVLKWSRRRPGLAAMAVVVQLLLASLLALGVWSYARINQALKVAKEERGRAIQALANESVAHEAADLARAEEARTRAASDRLSAELALKGGVDFGGSGFVARGLRWMDRSLELAPEDEEGRRLRRAARANILAWSDRAIVPRALVDVAGHIRSLAVSPDGRKLVAGCNDGAIAIWALPSGEPLARFQGQDAAVKNVEFRPNGQAFVTCFEGKPDAYLWDAVQYKPLGAPIRHANAGIQAAHFHPNGSLIALVGGETIRLWNSNSREFVRGPWEQKQFMMAQAKFSPDGRLLFGFGNNEWLYAWDWESGRAHAAPVDTVEPVGELDFSDDGRRFAVVVSKGLSIFETDTFRKLAASPPTGVRCSKVAFKPDGRFVAVGSHRGTVQFFDAKTAQPVGEPLIHGAPISTLAFSPDGRILLTAEASGASRLYDTHSKRLLDSVAGSLVDVGPLLASDGRTLVTPVSSRVVRVWDVANVSDPRRVLPFANSVQTAAFSPDGRLLATASSDGSARMFDVSTGLPHGAPRENPGYVRVARFSPDGRILATGGDDGRVHVWDVATGRRIGGPLVHPRWVVNATFSPDGKTLLVGCVEGWAGLWDLTTFKPIGPVLSHPSHTPGHEIWALAFGLDGRVAITASLEGTIRIWSTATGAPVGEILRYPLEVRQLRVPGNGRTMVFLEEGQVHTYDLVERRETRRPFGQRESVIAFGADDRVLLTGDDDGTARLWDLATGKPIGPAVEHPLRVIGVAISPDAKILLSITFDGTIQFWDVATGKPIGPSAKHEGFAPVDRIDDRLPVGFDVTGRLAFSAGNNVCLWRVPALVENAAQPSGEFASRAAGRKFDHDDERRPLDQGEWENLRRLATGDLIPVTPIDDDAWHDALAYQSQSEGSWIASSWHLDRLIAKHPGDWSLHARRSAANAGRDELDQAGRDLARARSLGPPAAVNAWRQHVGFDLLGQRRFKAAMIFLDGSVSGVPDDADLLFLRTLALTHLGRLDEAVAALKQAIDRGFREVDRLKTDGDLNPLRGRDDFKRLMAGLAGK